MAIRVHELAKEFGLPSRQILDAIAEIGEFAKSASSTIEAPVVKRLRDHLGRVPSRKPLERRAAPRYPSAEQANDRRRASGASPNRAAKPSALEVAAAGLGLDLSEVDLVPTPRVRFSKPTTHRRDAWSDNLFTREDRAQWRNVGVMEPTQALACIAAGLRPDDMTLMVGGRALWDRLQSGEAPVVLAAKLREAQAETG